MTNLLNYPRRSQFIRHPGWAPGSLQAGVDGVSLGYKNLTPADLVIDSDPCPFCQADPSRDYQDIIIVSGRPIPAVCFDYRQEQPLRFPLFIWCTSLPQEFIPKPFKVDQVVSVVYKPHLVGIRVRNPVGYFRSLKTIMHINFSRTIGFE